MLLSGLIGHLEFDFFIRPVINCSCFLSLSPSLCFVLLPASALSYTCAYAYRRIWALSVSVCVCMRVLFDLDKFSFSPHTQHTHRRTYADMLSLVCCTCVCVSLYVCNCHHAASYCNFCCCFANFLDSLNLPTHTHTHRDRRIYSHTHTHSNLSAP